MGALSNNTRNPTDECFSYYNHITKKPRLLYAQTRLLSTTARYVPTSRVDSQTPSLSRLSKYPVPDKLSREVHAPCSSSRFGFLSKCKDARVRADMGSVLSAKYEQLRANALSSLAFVDYGKEEGSREVIDLETELEGDGGVSMGGEGVEILEDGNDVRSVVSDDSDGGLEMETRKLGGKGVESGVFIGSAIMSDLNKLEDARKLLGSISLGREEYKELLRAVDRNYLTKLSSLEFEIKSKEAKLQSIRLEKPKEVKKKLSELEESGKDLLRKPFVPLTEEEKREVALALSRSNRKKILAAHENSNIEITGEILQCLRPGAWLNDEVINVYLELLKERERREPKKFLNCHFFNTFFYKKLISGRNGYDYKAVRRWTTQKKLGYGLVDCDKIFVPIHREVHWCLAVINKMDKSFQYLDSLGGRDHHVLRVLARYFMDEVKDKSGQDIDVSSWDQEFVEDLPEQQNGFDCGVFMIKYADFYSRGLGLHFSQENMPYFRQRTAKEILRLRAD